MLKIMILTNKEVEGWMGVRFSWFTQNGNVLMAYMYT